MSEGAVETVLILDTCVGLVGRRGRQFFDISQARPTLCRAACHAPTVCPRPATHAQVPFSGSEEHPAVGRHFRRQPVAALRPLSPLPNLDSDHRHKYAELPCTDTFSGCLFTHGCLACVCFLSAPPVIVTEEIDEFTTLAKHTLKCQAPLPPLPPLARQRTHPRLIRLGALGRAVAYGGADILSWLTCADARVLGAMWPRSAVASASAADVAAGSCSFPACAFKYPFQEVVRLSWCLFVQHPILCWLV